MTADNPRTINRSIPIYTNRQLQLLREEDQPKNNEEWEWYQEHANDVVHNV